MVQMGDDRRRRGVTVREAMALIVMAAVALALVRFGGKEWEVEDWLDFALRFLALAPIVTVLVIAWARSSRPGAGSERPDGKSRSEE